MHNKKLTERDYWETKSKAGSAPAATTERRDNLKGKIRDRFFGKVNCGYANYLLYDIHWPRYLPNGRLKILEVGSSPGKALIAVHQKFGYDPYGVEYTASGAELNRRNFAEHGLDPTHVIHSDFFDCKFQAEHKEKFDVVMSHGFIEHFTNLDEVIGAHGNLIRPGGWLVLTVPNMRWANYLLIRFFAPRTIKAHNFNIMKKSVMLQCIPADQYEVLACRFLGTFNAGLIYGPNKGKFKLLLMNAIMRIQEVMDACNYVLFPRGFIESPLFSPMLLMIARKKPRQA